MPTIHTQASLYGADDVAFKAQHSKVRVVIHSHILATPAIKGNSPGVIDCSDDTIAMSTSKDIKSTGSASVTLVPRENYLNYIFPNDWINIWMNPGDGRGYIRVFFGFVNRIERSISTDGNGATSTFFELSCSDLTKAFEATNVYFNPHIADREDFVGNFAGTKNLGGSQLRSKGITAFGTPADIVMNFAHLLMGFGSQFIAPPEYPFNGALMEESRKFRRDWAKSFLSKEAQEAIGTDTITDWYDQLKKEAAPLADKLSAAVQNGDLGEVLSMSVKLGAGDLKDFTNAYARVQDDPVRVAIGLKLLEKGQKNLLDDQSIKSGLAIEETAMGPGHLLDLIDFTFVEHKAIDGSIVSAPIWTQQGPLWSLMNAYSNSMVNELFLDLRPLGKKNKEYGLIKGGYIQEPDEHFSGKKEENVAVRFVPAMIMREYPFSTIEGVDANTVEILGDPVGSVVFGPIFAQEPNIPGRKTVPVSVLNDYLYGAGTALKHLDVAVLSVRDIISENIGRSDAEVVNLIEVYSDGLMGKHMKYTTQDLQPIATPVSVARHGLRVQTYTTRFARFSKKKLTKHGIDTVGTRRKIARWSLMLDHWYQHNIEYLNGSITTRSFPEIRVGYRLDIIERRESYYVESVSHEWSYPDGARTVFSLSRGQRNDPFPVYEYPALPAMFGNRKKLSRLADIFRVKHPSATLRSLRFDPLDDHSFDKDSNFSDMPQYTVWGKDENAYEVSRSIQPDYSLLARAYNLAIDLRDLAADSANSVAGIPGNISNKLLNMFSKDTILENTQGSTPSNTGSKGSGVVK